MGWIRKNVGERPVYMDGSLLAAACSSVDQYDGCWSPDGIRRIFLCSPHDGSEASRSHRQYQFLARTEIHRQCDLRRRKGRDRYTHSRYGSHTLAPPRVAREGRPYLLLRKPAGWIYPIAKAPNSSGAWWRRSRVPRICSSARVKYSSLPRLHSNSALPTLMVDIRSRLLSKLYT